MRGEHVLAVRMVCFGSGSSPHARGALYYFVALECFNGIIPACAGSTQHIILHTGKAWDHPRMRGEHALLFLSLKSAKGSSPHARGALL